MLMDALLLIVLIVLGLGSLYGLMSFAYRVGVREGRRSCENTTLTPRSEEG